MDHSYGVSYCTAVTYVMDTVAHLPVDRVNGEDDPEVGRDIKSLQ